MSQIPPGHPNSPWVVVYGTEDELSEVLMKFWISSFESFQIHNLPMSSKSPKSMTKRKGMISHF